jgi:lincosamide nucleotidyltransferase A/C/D/E
MAMSVTVPMRQRVQVRARVAALATAERMFNAVAVGPLARVRSFEPLLQFRLRWRHALNVAFTLDDVVEVLDAFDRAGVRGWLAGGWGIDALVGRQTRPHTDLDLVVSSDELERILDALREHGYRRGPARHDPEGFLPVHEMVRDAAGRVIELHPADLRTWPGDELTAEPFARGSLDGRPVDCLSVEAQRVGSLRGLPEKPEYRTNLRVLDEVAARAS